MPNFGTHAYEKRKDFIIRDTNCNIACSFFFFFFDSTAVKIKDRIEIICFHGSFN